MELLRQQDGSAVFVDAAGAVVARLLPTDPADAGYAALLDRLASNGSRVLLRFKEGLLEEAAADAPCQLVLIEDDRFGDPPLAIRRRDITGDEATVQRLFDDATRRQAVVL